MARSTRVLYNNVIGTSRHNYNWDPIHKSSAVIITAAQWQVNALGSGDLDGRPWLDEAVVYVTNVGPHDPEGGPGGVEFFLHVDLDPAKFNPISVIVTITVLDDVESFTEA